MFQKKVLVLASLMAVAAVAQAQVKVYGYVELDVGSYQKFNLDEGPVKQKSTQVSSGNMMTSFIGFAGSEDLGGGLKAEFTLESFIAPDTGSTVNNNAGKFWGRGSNVALSGSFGKVALGQYDNPLFVSGLSYNPFGSSMMFSPTMRHYYGLGNGVAVGPALTVDTGFVNSITYETPDMGGFMATVQYAPKETSKSVNPSDKDSLTIGASYNAGPLSVMAVYADNGLSSASDTNDFSEGTGAYLGKQKVTSLAGSYDFGVAKGFLQYTDVDNDAATTGDDVKLYQIGATVPVSAAGKVMVSYGQSKIKAQNSTDKIISLGYDHTLSKRTGVFAAYSQEKATLFSTSFGTANTVAAGIRHSF